MKLRIPWWASSPATVLVDGKPLPAARVSSGFLALKRRWHNETVRVKLPKSLTVSEIPDEPETVAFLDGPVVLAALSQVEHTLIGDRSDPSSLLVPDNEREWGNMAAGLSDERAATRTEIQAAPRNRGRAVHHILPRPAWWGCIERRLA